MPFSHPENKVFALKKLLEVSAKSVLDVGAGAGQYGNLYRSIYSKNTGTTIDALEIWQPYIEQYNLAAIYDKVILGDAISHTNYSYDLVIMGDILEHMSEQDALLLYEKVKSKAKYCLFSIPVIHMPQDAAFGNPYEVHHKEDWTHKEILSKFSNIIDYEKGSVVGIYLAKFR